MSCCTVRFVPLMRACNAFTWPLLWRRPPMRTSGHVLFIARKVNSPAARSRSQAGASTSARSSPLSAARAGPCAVSAAVDTPLQREVERVIRGRSHAARRAQSITWRLDNELAYLALVAPPRGHAPRLGQFELGDVLAPLAHEQTIERDLVGAQIKRQADVRQGKGLLRLRNKQDSDEAQEENLEHKTLDVQRPR